MRHELVQDSGSGQTERETGYYKLRFPTDNATTEPRPQVLMHLGLGGGVGDGVISGFRCLSINMELEIC